MRVPIVDEDAVSVPHPQGDVEVAVVVEIHGATVEGFGAGEGGAGLACPLNEFILAAIKEKKRRAVVAEEHEIRIAVVVEIRKHRPAHSPLGGGQP